jgi:AsmA-like protein
MEQRGNADMPQRKSRWPFWVGGSLLAFLVTVAIVLEILAHRAEPFMRQQVVQALSDRFHAHVELDSFHLSLGNTLRGEWGVWGEGKGLRIWPPAEVEGVQVPIPKPLMAPLVRLDEFHFHAPLHYTSGQPIHITMVRLKGLDIHFPPRSRMRRASEPKPENDSSKPTVSLMIDALDCTDVRFTHESDDPNKVPLEFLISRFRAKKVHSGSPVNFEAIVQNPKPPGEIHTTGSFGPWVVNDPGNSPIRGDYTFKHADLSVFNGIGGILDSTGHYIGTLRDMQVDGQTDTPDFQLERYGHTMVLHTDFDARVDGTTGDTWLKSVNATMDSSHFITEGQVVRVLKMGEDGRMHSIGHDISLKVNVDRARIEDFLRLSTDSPVPILDGGVQVQAQLHIIPGKASVIDRMTLKGNFQLNDAEFTNLGVQKKIRELSLRGQGKPDQLKSAEEEKIKSQVQGEFDLRGGVLTIPKVTYAVPGADIHLHGTYRTKGQTLDFTGTAKMQATISKMVGGWKGFLLKPADRFFKKNGAGAEIPIYIAGTRDEPHFGYNGSGGSHADRPDR